MCVRLLYLRLSKPSFGCFETHCQFVPRFRQEFESFFLSSIVGNYLTNPDCNNGTGLKKHNREKEKTIKAQNLGIQSKEPRIFNLG